jgi:molybdenum cofactor synthesis domain-containing protein
LERRTVARLMPTFFLCARGGERRFFYVKQEPRMKITAAVVTISDKGYAGQRADESGPALAEALVALGAEVTRRMIVPDDPEAISAALRELADSGLDLVMTTGGTGATPRDNTPEATLAVIERPMPGIAELLRAEGYKKTPLAVLSRGVAGLRGKCLIVNLPGSTRAVREGMETLARILPHAVQMAQGQDTEHGAHHHHDH